MNNQEDNNLKIKEVVQYRQSDTVTSKKKVESYSLMEFMSMTDELKKENYVFDFESNENCPVAFGGYYQCIMVRYGEPFVALAEETVADFLDSNTVVEVKDQVQPDTAQVSVETKVRKKRNS